MGVEILTETQEAKIPPFSEVDAAIQTIFGEYGIINAQYIGTYNDISNNDVPMEAHFEASIPKGVLIRKEDNLMQVFVNGICVRTFGDELPQHPHCIPEIFASEEDYASTPTFEFYNFENMRGYERLLGIGRRFNLDERTCNTYAQYVLEYRRADLEKFLLGQNDYTEISSLIDFFNTNSYEISPNVVCTNMMPSGTFMRVHNSLYPGDEQIPKSNDPNERYFVQLAGLPKTFLTQGPVVFYGTGNGAEYLNGIDGLRNLTDRGTPGLAERVLAEYPAGELTVREGMFDPLLTEAGEIEDYTIGLGEDRVRAGRRLQPIRLQSGYTYVRESVDSLVDYCSRIYYATRKQALQNNIDTLLRSPDDPNTPGHNPLYAFEALIPTYAQAAAIETWAGYELDPVLDQLYRRIGVDQFEVFYLRPWEVDKIFFFYRNMALYNALYDILKTLGIPEETLSAIRNNAVAGLRNVPRPTRIRPTPIEGTLIVKNLRAKN